MEELRSALGDLCLEGDGLVIEETPENLLGRSQFSVYKGMYKSMRVAVKLIPLASGQDLGLLQREIQGLRLCAGPAVLHLYGVLIRNNDLAIITELMSCSLADYAYGKKKGQLTYKQSIMIALELARGILHIHSFGFVHRDIKPENAMLDDFFRPKWGDFGLVAALLTTNLVRTESHGSGTPHFMSPEQMDGDGDTPVTRATDIYAFGSTLLSLFTGQLPWPATMTFIQLIRKVVVAQQKPPVPTDLPPSLQKLLNSCLEFDAKNRPTAEQLVAALEALLAEVNGGPSDPVQQQPQQVQAPTVVQKPVTPVPVVAPTPQPTPVLASAPQPRATPPSSQPPQPQPQPIPTVMTAGKSAPSTPPVVQPVPPQPQPQPVAPPQLTQTQIIDALFVKANNLLYGWQGMARNPFEAMLAMKQCAEAGHPRAMSIFAGWLGYGCYFTSVDKNYCHHLYIRAAAAGDRFAIAICMREGYGTYAKDERKAFEMIYAMDWKNDPHIMVYVATAFYWERGVAKDEARGFELYMKAAQHGHCQGHCSVGLAYRLGQGVKKDDARGVHHYQIAADMGYALAIGFLGVAYRKGEGCVKDEAKSIQLLTTAVQRGCNLAMFNLGLSYENGNGVRVDKARAIALYQQAAALQNKYAIQRLEALGYRAQ